MAHFRAGSAALCGAGSLLMSAVAQACSTDLTLGIGSGIHAGTAGCIDRCLPSACPPGSIGLPQTTDSSGRGGLPFDIEMAKFAFLPSEPIIRPNTTVRWSNNSLFSPHTSTRLPTWDSGTVNPNEFFDFRFTATHAGLQYHYTCQFHFGMEGDINVAHFGDANLDGVVNLPDFNILAANFGASGTTWEQGDFNEDGQINLQDFNLLAGSFGQEIQPAGFLILDGFVPEPAIAALLAPGFLLLGRRRRHGNL